MAKAEDPGQTSLDQETTTGVALKKEYRRTWDEMTAFIPTIISDMTSMGKDLQTEVFTTLLQTLLDIVDECRQNQHTLLAQLSTSARR